MVWDGNLFGINILFIGIFASIIILLVIVHLWVTVCCRYKSCVSCCPVENLV